VVIVEDNDDSRITLKLALEMEGHEVHEASDGAEGLDVIERVRPDVALIDIGMPGMNGYEVARALRTRYCGKLTLIALTGYGLADDERKSQEAGFDAHLAKPADFERLNSLIVAAAKQKMPA